MALYVNGEHVDEQEIANEVERLRPYHDQVFAEKPSEERERQLREWCRENVIERTLLRQAARRDPDPISPEDVAAKYQAMLEEHGGAEKFYESRTATEEAVKEEITVELWTERLLDRLAGPLPEPNEEEMRQYYEENRDHFTAPAMVRVSHIVKHPSPATPPSLIRKKMAKILKKLREEGANFEETARTHSDCPDNGGDLGYFPRGRMVKEFDDVVFTMKAGQISDVFRTPFGFHVAKVTDKRPPTLVPFAQARDRIRTEITDKHRQKALEAFLDEERKKASIEEK